MPLALDNLRLMPPTYLLLMAVALNLAACSSNPGGLALQHTQFYADPVLLQQTPFFPQEDYQCGPAALATVLGASGVAVHPDQLVNAVYVPARKGSLQIEMLAAARAQQRLAYQIDPNLTALLTEVRAGMPVLVMQNLGLSWLPQWHYAVVTGYDLARGVVILNSGTIKNYQLKVSVFEKTWNRADNWGFVVVKPGELPEQVEENRYFESTAAFENTSGPAAALPAYQAGLARWPQNQLISAALANSFYNLGQLDEAIKQFEKLLTLHPQFADAHNNLAFLLLQRGDHESARLHAEQAVTLGGDRSQIYQQTLQQIQTAASF